MEHSKKRVENLEIPSNDKEEIEETPSQLFSKKKVIKSGKQEENTITINLLLLQKTHHIEIDTNASILQLKEKGLEV